MNDNNPAMDLIARLRRDIREVSPTEAISLQQAGALVLDVREESERTAGTPQGAIGLSRGFLELRCAALLPDRQRQILTLCGSGQRSLLAAGSLRQLGYANVASIAGGFARWQAEGLPLAVDSLDADSLERYARQLRLPQVGAAGQARLAQARVVVVGAGGLGAPLTLYLTAAGVGHISVIDNDRVERSNLHRQVIHADARVGMPKTDSARMTLVALNPHIHIETHTNRLAAGNVEALLAEHDVIVDGTDSFPARYLISTASRQLGIPMVYGAVQHFDGQASVFDPRSLDSPCYRCLFPEPPAAGDAPNCSEAGVLGVLPGLIGLIQATETLKLLLDIGQPLVGRLLMVDALAMHFREISLPRDPACPGCGAGSTFQGYRDIGQIRSIS